MAISESLPYVHTIPGVATRNHRLYLPLDYMKPNGQKIVVFAREVIDSSMFEDRENLPWIINFQGGPGFECCRPDGALPGWLKCLLEKYRVLLLDQRGTGLSTAVTVNTYKHFSTSQTFAEYLTHFRQTDIVRDAESFRERVAGGKKWAVAGQSFGGWCITTYLSFYPESIEHALITGGLPPVLRTIEEVYAATYNTVIEKNTRYYSMFPQDIAAVQNIMLYLTDNKVILPNGDHLTPRRFQQLGFCFIGGGAVTFPALHDIIERAWETTPIDEKHMELSPFFFHAVQGVISWECNPLYVLLHEQIYLDGPGKASNWAAHRGRPDAYKTESPDNERVNFTAETMYPWLLDDVASFRPMKEVANILATKSDWEPLYDRVQLKKNTVPIAAVVYYEDCAVTRDFSLELAKSMGNCKVWITNEYEHNGKRIDGKRIMSRLIGMIENTEYFSW